MKNLIITIKNVYSILSDYTNELEELLTIKHENYWFSPQYKKGFWDGKTHFLKLPSLRVPTGLLFIIYEYCKTNNIKVEIIDERLVFQSITNHPTKDMLSGVILRDYQLDAVKTAIKNQRGVLQLPTGSGKTEVAIAIINVLRCKTLYLVHTKDLLHQTVARFKERIPGIDVKPIGDGYTEWGEDVTVGMIQTINSILKRSGTQIKKLLNSFSILILDECHHASATSWYKIAMFCHSSFYRFGLSGTPLAKAELSNVKLHACIGEQIYSLKVTELIEAGDLSEIEITMIDNPEMVTANTWSGVYSSGIVHSNARNKLITDVAKELFSKDKNILILVKEVAHGNIISDLLTNLDVSNVFLYGMVDSKTRAYATTIFQQKENKFVIIATSIFDEGVDIPEINALILAGGGKSQIKTIQRIGRGLRKKQDGSKLLVYDFKDSSSFLVKHSKKRMYLYKEAGFIT